MQHLFFQGILLKWQEGKIKYSLDKFLPNNVKNEYNIKQHLTDNEIIESCIDKVGYLLYSFLVNWWILVLMQFTVFYCEFI